jgi:hypothetical protein
MNDVNYFMGIIHCTFYIAGNHSVKIFVFLLQKQPSWLVNKLHNEINYFFVKKIGISLFIQFFYCHIKHVSLKFHIMWKLLSPKPTVTLTADCGEWCIHVTYWFVVAFANAGRASKILWEGTPGAAASHAAVSRLECKG